MRVLACTQSTMHSAEVAHKKEKGVPVDKEPTKCVCRTNCIERPLRGYFERHGRYVAKHPYPFFIIPLILTVCMGYGLRHLHIIDDLEYLVTPKNGDSKSERQVIQEHFHVDQNGGFMPERSPSLDGFLDVIIASRDGSNVLTSRNLEAILRLEQLIHNASAPDDSGQTFRFKDICSTWEDDCMEHPILLAYKRNPALVDTTHITYPKHGYFFMGHSLGNVTVEEGTNYVTYAGATRLTFFVRYESAKEQELANRWFKAVMALMENVEDPNLEIFYSATNSLAVQFDEASADIVPKFAAPFVLLITFSVMSCMMNDWVRSKPYLAFMGVLATGCSLCSTFGFLSALGISAAPQVGLVPFLTLGRSKLFWWVGARKT